MDTLPTELQDQICKLLIRHPSTLANLAMTSSRLLPIARWALYEHFELASDSPFYKFTYHLFEREKGLRRAVVSFKLITRPSYSHQTTGNNGRSTWIDERVFCEMTRLRSITFNGIPCNSGKRFQHVIASVYEHCPRLEEISVSSTWQQNVFVNTQSILRAKLDVPFTLKKISLGTTCSLEKSFFSSTFFTPSNAVTTLELPCGTGILKDVVSLKFPKLHTFSLWGFFGRGGLAITEFASAQLLAFLHAHPTIQKLFIPHITHLSIASRSNYELLPNLDVISGIPICIASLSRICDRLKFVRCLILNFAGCRGGTTTQMDELKSTIPEFPRLVHCTVRHIYNTDTLRVLRNLPEAQGLEWWTGGFYYHDLDSMNPISSALSCFPKLTRIDVLEWSSPPERMTEMHLEAFRNMTELNQSIQKICLFMSHTRNHEIATVFNVDRKEGLQRIYQYSEECPPTGARRYVQFDEVDWQYDPPL